MKIEKVFLYPSLGGSFSMNRYLNGVQQGLEANNISWELVSPGKNSAFNKYLKYPILAWTNRKREGKHLIISERYAYLLHFLKRADTIIVCHDLHTLHPEAKTLLFHRWIYQFFIKSMRKAKKIVCVSEYTKHELIKYCKPFKGIDSIETIHNGIEEFWLSKDQGNTEIMPWLNIFDNKKVLLSIGTDEWYKNNSWSLRLISELPEEFHLLRIGSFGKTNKILLKQLDISNRVSQVTGISDEVLKYAYLHSWALLFPSHSEGYGWPALEAALMDCSVVSDGNGATVEIFGKPNTLISLREAKETLMTKLDSKQHGMKYWRWSDQVKRLIA